MDEDRDFRVCSGAGLDFGLPVRAFVACRQSIQRPLVWTMGSSAGSWPLLAALRMYGALCLARRS